LQPRRSQRRPAASIADLHRDGAHLAPLPLEAAAVWVPFLVVSAEIVVTYSRLPARELYHVSGSGLEGGLSRTLVFSNFPVALVAIAVLAFLADRAMAGGTVVAAIVGAVLCAAVFWPGVVDEANLDARWVNAVSATGVLIALALTALALRGGREWSPRQRGDPARIVIAVAALLLALPWLAAEVGFFLDGVPLLGRLFQTGPYSDHVALPGVHHGHHHGIDGVLLLLSALLLSRAVPAMRHRILRVATGLYLALMAAYGIANAANDFWSEQVVKRGWTTWAIPNVLNPKLSLAWALIVVGAVALYAIARGEAST
jgi:hypothetical protein